MYDVHVDCVHVRFAHVGRTSLLRLSPCARHLCGEAGRVSVADAQNILVLGASRNPRVADSVVLSTLCALQSLPDRLVSAANADIVLDLAQVTTREEMEPGRRELGGRGSSEGKGARREGSRRGRGLGGRELGSRLAVMSHPGEPRMLLCLTASDHPLIPTDRPCHRIARAQNLAQDQNVTVARQIGGASTRTVLSKSVVNQLLATTVRAIAPSCPQSMRSCSQSV